MSEENRDLLMGVFCTTADSAPALDALTTAVVRDLSERDGLLTAQIMRASVASNSRTLGVENAFVVYCSPGPAGAPTADYCLSSACAPIENPKEICAEIAGALGE